MDVSRRAYEACGVYEQSAQRALLWAANEEGVQKTTGDYRNCHGYKFGSPVWED